MKKELEKSTPRPMKTLGWLHVQKGSEGMKWMKFDSNGIVLAEEGDSIWHTEMCNCLLEQEKMQVTEKEEIVRVLRILEYVGPRELVKSMLKARVITETHHIRNDFYISEIFLSLFPTKVTPEEVFDKCNEESKE